MHRLLAKRRILFSSPEPDGQFSNGRLHCHGLAIRPEQSTARNLPPV
jgi:hypothetical protein